MNLNQVTVPSTDVERAMNFYRKLGLILIVKSLPGYARFVCPDGSSTFSIHKVDKMNHPSDILIYFECKDLDHTVAQLKSQGIQFTQDPVDQRWLWREARLEDPDGNRLCLFYGGTNRIDPPWRVQPES